MLGGEEHYQNTMDERTMLAALGNVDFAQITTADLEQMLNMAQPVHKSGVEDQVHNSSINRAMNHGRAVSPNAVLPPIVVLPSTSGGSPHLSSKGSDTTGLEVQQALYGSGNSNATTLPKSDPVMDEKERTRLKNRRNQAKYRERKKVEREKARDELDHITLEVERLRLENERLNAKKGSMEQVMSVRDDIVTILQADAVSLFSNKVTPRPARKSRPPAVAWLSSYSYDHCRMMNKLEPCSIL